MFKRIAKATTTREPSAKDIGVSGFGLLSSIGEDSGQMPSAWTDPSVRQAGRGFFSWLRWGRPAEKNAG